MNQLLISIIINIYIIFVLPLYYAALLSLETSHKTLDFNIYKISFHGIAVRKLKQIKRTLVVFDINIYINVSLLPYLLNSTATDVMIHNCLRSELIMTGILLYHEKTVSAE